MEVKLAGVPITTAKERPSRFTALFWGDAGCGKTTLAATAPGRKLLINFDPDGPASIATRPDIDVADFSAEGHNITEKFKQDNILGLNAVIEEYDTIIVDSLTNATFMALQRGIESVNNSTIEKPAIASYQTRNALTVQLVKRMLRLTGKHNKHCIFIAHEGTPDKNADGVVLQISIMLGGQLPNDAPKDLSEVWALTDTGKERRIAIRPVRMRKPMKSRMFSTAGAAEFVWKFNPEKWEGHMITDWWDAWIEGGKEKLPLPK